MPDIWHGDSCVAERAAEHSFGQRAQYMKANFVVGLITAGLLSPLTHTSASDDFDRGLKLAEQKGCLDCHALGRAYVGPSFTAIAKRYHRNPEYRDRLSYVIRGGSAGHWGDRFVMWPQASLSEKDVRELVDWIMSQ
jgi:cytochrome c551/c552